MVMPLHFMSEFKSQEHFSGTRRPHAINCHLGVNTTQVPGDIWHIYISGSVLWVNRSIASEKGSAYSHK